VDPNLSESHRAELLVEVRFYGLLDLMAGAYTRSLISST